MREERGLPHSLKPSRGSISIITPSFGRTSKIAKNHYIISNQGLSQQRYNISYKQVYNPQ